MATPEQQDRCQFIFERRTGLYNRGEQCAEEKKEGMFCQRHLYWTTRVLKLKRTKQARPPAEAYASLIRHKKQRCVLIINVILFKLTCLFVYVSTSRNQSAPAQETVVPEPIVSTPIPLVSHERIAVPSFILNNDLEFDSFFDANNDNQ